MCNPVTTAFPERLLAKGTHLGFEWEVTANGMAFRCGYLRVPHTHPWHGLFYDDIRTADGSHPDVHGGLTFSGPDASCGKGGADNAWWIGFDCAHYMDAPDPQLPGYHELPLWAAGTIRTTEYVTAECIRLAHQAAQLLDGVVAG
jgi:hypothetical protein